MEKINYVHTVPDSHFWTDLKQLVNILEFDINWRSTKEEKEDLMLSVNTYKLLTKEHLIIGLKNSLKNGYEIKKVDYNVTVHNGNSFFSIDDIIFYIQSNKFLMKIFIEHIKNTLKFGYNLKHIKKMERKDVYDRLDTERDYQDLRWSTRRTADGTPDEEKPPAEWINYMEYHLSKAKDAVYHLQTDDALAEVRKVAALAVRCLELYGCPERMILPNLEEDE